MKLRVWDNAVAVAAGHCIAGIQLQVYEDAPLASCSLAPAVAFAMHSALHYKQCAPPIRALSQ